jgi:hypothetical protein
MKTAIALTAAGLLSFGLAGPAAAYHLIPLNTSFTGTGSTSATKNGVSLACKATFHGHVDANGVGWVDDGSFKNGDLGCTAVSLSNLPWKSTANKATKVKILNATFSSPIGNCGPGTVQVRVKNGVISFTDVPLPGGCTVSGKIKTSPALSIVP